MSRLISLDCSKRVISQLENAIKEGGAELVAHNKAEGLIFARPFKPERLAEILDENHPDYSPNLEWIQLPYAGIEPFLEVLAQYKKKYKWTCGKGVYARPVAEMALALMLAGFRQLNTYILAKSWEAPIGENLIGATVLIIGGGGIAEELVKLLLPFECNIHIVRRHKRPLGISLNETGATKIEIHTPEALANLYQKADSVVLALSLTKETENIINKKALSVMKKNCWLINVARGKHIDTNALVEALSTDAIAGAGLDVTEPEPLPDDHPLWNLPNCIITPHTANTPEMGIALLVDRIKENVKRFCNSEELLGPVYPDLRY